MEPGGKLKPIKKKIKKVIASNKKHTNIMINIMKG